MNSLLQLGILCALCAICYILSNIWIILTIVLCMALFFKLLSYQNVEMAETYNPVKLKERLEELETSQPSLLPDEDQATKQLSKIQFSVATAILIHNFSEWTLKYQKTFMKSGCSVATPNHIQTQKGAIATFRKTEGYPNGTSGTVSWKIGDTGYEFVLAWHIPYNAGFSVNKLAVGVFEQGKHLENGNEMFDLMFDSRNGRPVCSNCKIGEYRYKDEPIKFLSKDIPFAIVGGMGTSRKTLIKISVYSLD